MTWRDNLQAASFRGVPFHAESADGTYGRRVEVFEYPQRDTPFSEDLGRKAREKSLVVFVIGDDYMTKRDNLLAALETPGAGELVHPWYGRLNVVVTDVRVSETITEGGMCRFTISFTEAGELKYPSAAASTQYQSKAAADALEQAAKETFSKNFSVDNIPEFAVLDAENTFLDALDGIDAALGNAGVILRDPLGLLVESMGDYIRTPATFATKFFGIFNKTSAVLSSASGLRDINSLNFLNVFKTLRLVSNYSYSATSGNTATRTKMATNKTAANTLIRQALLVQAVGMSATMELPVYDDAVSLKKELLSTLDNEAAVADDTTYLTLANLRSKVHQDMSARVRDSARLVNVTPKEVMPAIVLAYDLYEDAGRENEIIARNKLRHPGFTPATSLKVLNA